MDFIGDILSAPFICFGWIVVGMIAGALARSIMKSGNRPLVSDLILGIAGAFVGGLLAGLFGLAPGDDSGGLSLVIANLIIATIGAMVLIGVRRAVFN